MHRDREVWGDVSIKALLMEATHRTYAQFRENESGNWRVRPKLIPVCQGQIPHGR